MGGKWMKQLYHKCILILVKYINSRLTVDLAIRSITHSVFSQSIIIDFNFSASLTIF